ncbi:MULTISPECIES: phage minor head protein [unclassified Mesorhizobium]|uniref:phage minor head protein n=1 Tax=unclassified Mesorhizobium TaxID=325217 RepID=UPI001FE2289E|nr:MULTISPECIES: phage minor head protein [unclassified Mesorhizobium]
MLKKLSPAEKVAILLDQYAAAIRAAFLQTIRDIRASVILRMFVNRVEARDFNGALEALNLEPALFNPVLDEVAKAYSGGGNSTISTLPPLTDPEGFRITLLFDARNPTAEQWLRSYSARLVTEILDDQRNSIRAALANGTAQGLSGRAMALDIVGRINPATGERTGGLIGLTSSQAEWVDAYRQELQSLDAAALGRNLRDRRYDRTIRKAIADEKPLPAATIDNMVTAYQNRALQFRGEAIGRTESLAAFQSGADEAMRQNIASGKVPANLVDQKWNTLMDGRERDSHAAMNGQIKPWGEPFVTGAGYRLDYPGDPKAPASEIINCRCNKTFIIRKEPRPLLQ